MGNSREQLPTWFGNAAIRAARDQDGHIIGATIICLVEHDNLTMLPDLLLESAHKAIDLAAAEDARNRSA